MKFEKLKPGDMRDALALLNPWQRDFPLVREPYAVLAQRLGWSCLDVIQCLQVLTKQGALSRIGAVFNAHTGGAALLSAMVVPIERLQEVAAIVSAHPGVNHNYEREDRFNLWFVMSSCDAFNLEQDMLGLERATGLPALRLRMVKPYRIDLGFDLRERTASQPVAQISKPSSPVTAAEQALVALVEEGLPLVERPFDVWANKLDSPPEDVLSKLEEWLESGTLRRFGTIVRHHEFGFEANAMTVINVPDDQVDERGQRLALQAGVTLAYRRERAADWSYNLYFMVHGRHRHAVVEVITRVISQCALDQYPRKVLFSRQRFKQTGARRFRALSVPQSPESTSTPKELHAFA